jgi:hypothetical protein
MGQSNARQPSAASAPQAVNAPTGVGPTPNTSATTTAGNLAPGMTPETTQSLQAAVSASLNDVTPDSENEKKFVFS